MAKGYRAKHDVSFPRVLSRSGEGDNVTEATEGTNYPAGSIITHDSLPQHVQQRAESGSLSYVLDPVSDEEVDDHLNYQVYGGPESEAGIFVPEHEAEAHALEMGGHRVIPREQVLDALSSGEQHTRQYQEAVKDAGLDRRPHQEFLAEQRERVPDELLTGRQTPSGTPHDRGPEQDEDYAGGDEDGGEEEHSTRARPPVGSNSEEPPSGEPVRTQEAGGDQGGENAVQAVEGQQA